MLSSIVCLIFVCVAAKNVAADIAAKLCESVATKLEGKVLGTFGSEFWFSLSSYIWKVWFWGFWTHSETFKSVK